MGGQLRFWASTACTWVCCFTGLRLAGHEGMEKNGNYHNGLDKKYYKDPFLDS